MLIVTDTFHGMTLQERHKMIYSMLSDELQRIHAINLITKTVNEFE